MLRTKNECHRSIGFETEDFLSFFTRYSRGGCLDQVTQLLCINFHSHGPISFHIKGGVSIRPFS